MANQTIVIDDALHDYLCQVGFREPEILTALRNETKNLAEHGMQISPEQGQLMSMLVKLTGTMRAIEVGVFTGYSSMCVALALPEGGHLTACDISEEYTAIARKFWKKAGVADKIDLRIGPANETLTYLLEVEEDNSYDFAFIDADKVSYDLYYEKCLKLVRHGGLIAIDNVLQRGRVVLASEESNENVRAIKALNEKIAQDDRVDVSMVPIGDGLTLVRKR